MTIAAPPPGPDATITAVLGPTNTGKTHFAIERMLGHATGVIGLPLRLLAREVYDRVVELRGPGAAALITGEEKIQPANARYFICTVEAMPLDRGAAFLAVDEVQMCADPERGHVFTDRLLRARGRYETLFLGSDAARPRIRNLVPAATYTSRERFSTLTYGAPKKISRLKPRSAIVAFSIDQVYAIAELIRRQRGGAAVVMGALSPRTRNAQVALYQQGDVDYLVATDAIGMGLNLDIDHVAFAGLSKFDGHRTRRLEANELAQIAGRAGRFTRDGTFGVTGEAPPIEPEVVQAIEGHRFKPIAKLMWRNADLDFGTVARLIASLEQSPESPDLARAREAEDLATLRVLAEEAEIRALASRPDRIRRLWDVCQVPDFRKVAGQDHTQLVSRIYRFLLGPGGVIPSDWIAGQVKRIDRTEGDIDTLAKRLAFIRTWTYVANRADWLEDARTWQETTRAVEDRLSDALHERLTQRFVDRRTSVLLRRLKQKERLVAEVNENGEVTVEGEYLGRLDGFRFTVDETATPDESRTLRSASLAALQAEFARRADRLYLAPDTAIDVTEQGGIVWDGYAIGRLVKGDEAIAPKVQVFVDDLAEAAVAEKVERRLSHWIARRVQALFEPVVKMQADETVTGLARGVAFQLSEAMGVLPRKRVADDIKALGQEERALLRKHGVRFGQHTIFQTAMLKPAPTRLRILLWGVWTGLEDLPAPPPPGQVTIAVKGAMPQGYWERAGYRLCGARAVRIDMLERLADLIRPMDVRGGFEATADMLSITGCTLEQFSEIMTGLGFTAETGERPKPPRAQPQPSTGAGTAPDSPASDSSVPDTPAPDTLAPDMPEQDTLAPDGPAPDAAGPDAAGPDAIGPGDATLSPQPAEPTPEATEPAHLGAPEAPPPLQRQEPAVDQSATPAESGVPSLDQPSTATAATADETPSDGSEPAVQEAPSGNAAPAETETYYVFTLKPRRAGGHRRKGAGQAGERRDGQARSGGAPRSQGAGSGKPGGKGKKGKLEPKSEGGGKDRARQAQPPRKRQEKPFDPDSPFAVLQQLKGR